MTKQSKFPTAPRTRARVAIALVLVAMAAYAGTAAAQPENISNLEIKLLPEYCPDTQTFNGYGMQSYNWSPNAPKWLGLMGPGFWTMHHYCWALIRLGRIRSSTPPVIRKGLREAALSDLSFIVQNAPADFIMLPEIFTKMGEVDLALDRNLDAQQAFIEARRRKPDYWPAYSRWAEHLIQSGRKAEARQVLQDGLANAPTSTTLQRMYRELGGDPTKVAPAPVAEKPETN